MIVPVLLGALFLVALALSVFGGGSDDSFADEVEAVCRDANEDVVASQAVLPADATDEQATLFLGDVYVDLQRERLEALRALDGGGDDYAELLADHEAAVERVEADPAAFLRADPFADVEPRWIEFGAPSCGGATVE